MNDYISRETAIIEIERYAAELTPEWAPKQNIIIEDIENIINYDVAPADVELVKRGKWTPTKDDNKKQCSHCGVIHLIAQYPHGKANFCPNCGADMREDSEPLQNAGADAAQFADQPVLMPAT